MNLNDINKLGLTPQTIADIDFDHVAAITHDEFVRPTPKGKSYRELAIDRIVKSKLPLYNNCNIAWELLSRYVKLVCPYCNTEMKLVNGGGCGSTSSGEWRCQTETCKATASLTLDNNAALNFNPKDS